MVFGWALCGCLGLVSNDGGVASHETIGLVGVSVVNVCMGGSSCGVSLYAWVLYSAVFGVGRHGSVEGAAFSWNLMDPLIVISLSVPASAGIQSELQMAHFLARSRSNKSRDKHWLCWN